MPTVRRCCIIGCVSNSREKPQLQFFQFPKPEHPFHKLWMQACQASLNRILPFKKPVVCALHFHPKNIGGRRLTGNAIPCMQLDVPLNLRALEQQNMAQEIERSRKYVFLNAVVYEWLVRSNLNPNIRGSVTHGMIKEKAEIAKNIIGLDGFVADNRWLNTFRETQLKGFAAKLAGNQLEPQGGSSLAIPDIIKDLEHLYPPANAEHMENVPEQYLNYIQQYGEYDEDEDDEKERNHMQQTNSLHHFTNGNHFSANSQINQDYSYNNIYNNNNNNTNNTTAHSLYGYNNYNNTNSNNNNNTINAIYNNYNQNNANNNIYYNQTNGGNYINYQQQQQHHHHQHQQHQQSQQQPNTYFNALTQKYTVTSTGFEGHSDSNYSSPQYSNTSQSPPVQTQLPQQQPPTNKRQKLDIIPTTKTTPTTTPITTKEQAQPQQICETVYIEDDDVEFVAETKLSAAPSCGQPSPKAQNMAASEPKSKVVEGKSSASPKSVSLSPQPNQQKLNAVLRVKSALQENNNFSTSTLASEVSAKEVASETCKVKKVTVLPNMKSLESYEEALAYLKPLEDFVLMKENFRAIGLLSQFEVILRRGVSATNSGRAKVAAEEP